MFSTLLLRTLVASLVVAAMPTAVLAALIHPGSWKQVSTDGRYVLVMVSPLPVAEDTAHQSFDTDEVRDIRTAYSQCGLYRNDGTTKPLWTLPHYFDQTFEFHIAPDGIHLVIADRDWYRYNHVAWFYANGQKLASYEWEELVSHIRIKALLFPTMVAHGEDVFDSDALTFTSRSEYGEVFVFDITSGIMLRRASPLPKYIGIALAVFVTTVFVLVLLMRHRRNQSPTRSHLLIGLVGIGAIATSFWYLELDRDTEYGGPSSSFCSLVVIVAIVLAWVAYSIVWIRLRRRERNGVGMVSWASLPSIRQPRAPTGLWLFGERGCEWIQVQSLSSDDANRLALLFPEAKLWESP